MRHISLSTRINDDLRRAFLNFRSKLKPILEKEFKSFSTKTFSNWIFFWNFRKASWKKKVSSHGALRWKTGNKLSVKEKVENGKDFWGFGRKV